MKRAMMKTHSKALVISSVVIGMTQAVLAGPGEPSSEIFKCEVTHEDGRATFILNAAGGANFNFTPADKKVSHVCRMRLIDMDDQSEGVVRRIEMMFTRGECEPALDSLDADVLQKITIMADVDSKSVLNSHVQWRRSRQPDVCEVEKARLFDLRLNAKKWLDGKWARSTASEKKR